MDLMNSYQDPQYGGSNESAVKKMIFVLSLVFALSIVGAIFFFIKEKKPEPQTTTEPIATTTKIELPSSEQNQLPDGEQYQFGSSTSLTSEKLFFSDHYKFEPIEVGSEAINYELPINVKADVTNYYEISRRLKLDDAVDELNKDGFTVIDNPYSPKKTNFLEVYDELKQNDIPIFITSDFLIYYYENSLKESYKSIEENVFYNDLWYIAKYLFDKSDKRYQDRLKIMGTSSDLLLEGERREAAFFAVVLGLLQPRKTQVSPETFNDAKFTEYEVEKYKFVLPSYLETDVAKELDNILNKRKKERSPVLLYEVDYSDYFVPATYDKKAKLFNFYQANVWLNSLFPLYYKDDQCRDCLLDKEDWYVSMISANLIAKDFLGSREAKNAWAKIYKLRSFFGGLRASLTYLPYGEKQTALFGKDLNIEQVFAAENLDKNLHLLKDELSQIQFAGLEGGLDKDKPEEMPLIGMKFLSDDFLPSEYIFSRLTGKRFGANFSKQYQNITTHCNDNKVQFRCRGIGFDVIGLVNPFKITYDYYLGNTSYFGYAQAVSDLKNEMKNFTKETWHNSNFWTYLDAVNFSLNYDYARYPDYMNSDNWKNRDINTFLGGWANIYLPQDKIIFKQTALKNKRQDNYDYVDLNINLINKLEANTKMAQEMFAALNVVKEKDPANTKLIKLYNDLENMRSIVAKQYKNEELSVQDKINLDNLLDQAVSELGQKSAKIEFNNDYKYKTESRLYLDNIELMGVVYKRGGNKYLAFGPVFKYREGR